MPNPITPTGNFVKETSTTGGTTNLTLSNISGRPSFNTRFGVGPYFQYAAKDPDSVDFENGAGHLSASSTLVRDKVFSNSLGTTAKINFDTTAVEIYTGESEYSALGHRRYSELFTSGTKSVTSPYANEVATLALTADRLYHIPWICPHVGPWEAIRFHCTSSGSAPDQVRVGIYNVTDAGGPGDLLVTTNDIDVSASGSYTDSLAATDFIEPGPYFISIAANDVCTLRGYSADSILCSWLGIASSEMYPICYLYETLGGAWTVLPATAAVAGSQTIVSNASMMALALTKS